MSVAEAAEGRVRGLPAGSAGGGSAAPGAGWTDRRQRLTTYRFFCLRPLVVGRAGVGGRSARQPNRRRSRQLSGSLPALRPPLIRVQSNYARGPRLRATSAVLCCAVIQVTSLCGGSLFREESRRLRRDQPETSRQRTLHNTDTSSVKKGSAVSSFTIASDTREKRRLIRFQQA